MKSKTKWGDFTREWRVIVCPSCGHNFVNRKRRRCPKCEIGLFAGSELMTDPNGHWWWPGRGWIPVSKLRAGDKLYYNEGERKMKDETTNHKNG